MIEFLRRSFEVDLPIEEAWEHLARIEAWPSWTAHIRRVTVHPPRSWERSGASLHLRVNYEHPWARSHRAPSSSRNTVNQCCRSSGKVRTVP